MASKSTCVGKNFLGFNHSFLPPEILPLEKEEDKLSLWDIISYHCGRRGYNRGKFAFDMFGVRFNFWKVHVFGDSLVIFLGTNDEKTSARNYMIEKKELYNELRKIAENNFSLEEMIGL